jgi:alpha-L-rhamnosidase
MDLPRNFICAREAYCDFSHPVAAPYFRRKFELSKSVQTAELVVCGLGFYRLFVNGKEITKGPLAPYISAPDDYIYYDSYDIAAEMRPGENVIGVLLGNGMQNAFGGYVWDFDKAAWRSAPKLALRAELVFDGGEQMVIESDERFLTSDSPILFDDLRSGEHYDARSEQPGWCAPGFDDAGWLPAIKADAPRGEGRLCPVPPIVVTQEMKPVSITPQQGGYLYDFGANCAGVCRLAVRGDRGQEISLEHGEFLRDGLLELKNIQFEPDGYVQKDLYVCKGEGVEIYTPGFTYHGFQYVLVKGIREDQATGELLTYLVMNSKLEERGGFRCSDEVLNKIQDYARRSDLANFYYFPTDCPHREKNGWTGDAALSAEHMLLNLDPESYFQEWLFNIRKTQTEQGALPGIIPTGGWGYHWGNGPAWDCVIVYLPYFTYLYRGDTEILRENATAILRYLNYLSQKRDEQGLLAFGLGDWCPPGKQADEYKAPLVLTDTVISMDICRKAADVFRALKMPLQERFAQELYQSLRRAARKYLVDFSTMIALGNCQTSQAMAIYYGVFEEAEKPAAFSVLERLVEEADRHLDTGILGARVLFHVLSAHGRSDLAYEMVVNPTYPSYGNWIARGATSLWEDFQPEGGSVASRNHHFFGDISAWFLKWIAGIQLNPHGEDVDEVLITPRLIPALQWAEGYHLAPAGKIGVKWSWDEDGIALTIEVPQQIHGWLRLEPGFAFEDGGCVKPVASGTYRVVKK